MVLAVFNAIAGVFADINACREFFNWITPGVIKARHQLLDEDNTAAQQRIQEEEQLKTKFAQFKNDLWKLKTTMPKMLDLIDRVEWQSHKKPAAELLPDIKDAVYDAEDLLDEFNYYALKVKVEESKNSGKDLMHDAFLEFFKSVEHCDHFNKVKEIQGNLDHIHDQSKDLGLHQAPQKFDKSIRPETSSFSDEPQIFGREKELELLVGKLGVRALKRGRDDGEARMTELPVLPIVGMGGVGKTTMAQQICNDSKVKRHFDCIIWTCVSDDFDTKRLIKEILHHLGQGTSSDNLDDLMKKLSGCVKSKRFLLVLDDMWDDILKEYGAGWNRFCAPLRNGLQGSMILVTSRSSEVANLVGTMERYELKGLQDDVFWEFFKLCAFGSTSSCNDLELECIGKDILPKLKGSPLAAKTLGRLLRRNLTKTHWTYILESELWQLRQDATDILPALRLSYMYLPLQLKRCFSICALYPKDHQFAKEFLVDIWIAQGYVEPQDASLCFDDLVNRSFFQKADHQGDKYVIHDLMHDTAQLVSKDECFIIKHASDIDKIPSNVRHLSIFSNENVGYSELKSICNKKTLRSLVCNESYSKPKYFASVIDCWFRELSKLRVLSFKLCRVKELPESIGNSKHLRYLCLSGSCTFSTLPSLIGCLHHLKTIDAQDCVFEMLPECFSDIISLQKFKCRNFTYNKDNSDGLQLSWSILGTSSRAVQMMDNQMEALPHWNLQRLAIKGYGGESFPSWLTPNLLPRLRSLQFDRCRNLQEKSFFVPLSLDSEGSDNLGLLEELYICKCPKIDWESSVAVPTSLRKLTLYHPGYPMDHIASCFRDLTFLTNLRIACPLSTSIPLQEWSSSLPSLEDLCIEGWISLTSTSIPLQEWSSSLPSLEDLCIKGWWSLASISVSEASSSSSFVIFSSLVKLTIQQCNKLLSLDEFLTSTCLPVVKNICVRRCRELTSMPVDRFHGFSCLQELSIEDCPKLNMQRILRCPYSLKMLSIVNCQGIKSIHTAALERLRIRDCPDLDTIGGSIAVAKIETAYINDCPELTEISQPFQKGQWGQLI